MADLHVEHRARHPSHAVARRRAANSSGRRTGGGIDAAPPLRGRSVLTAGILVLAAANAWAQQEAPVVVDRKGVDQVRVGERFNYQLEVRNQSDVPVKDVHIQEFVPQAGGGQEQQQGQARQQGQQGQKTQGGQKQGQQQAQGQNQGAQQQGQDGQQGQQQAQGQNQGAQQQGQQHGGPPSGGGEYGVSRTIPFLAPGESRTINVNGVARHEGTLRSCLAVDYTPATCADIRVVKPDIDLSCDMNRPEGGVYDAQDLDPSTFYACDTVVMTCHVRNDGTGATKPTRLTFNLPDGLQPADDSKGTKQIDSIDPGQERAVTLRIAPQRAGQYRLQPSLASDRGEMTAEPTSVRIIQPQLAVAIQAPNRQYLNRPMSYTVHVRNPGDVPVPSTRLKFDTPEQLENVSIASENVAGDDGSYNIGTLQPGDSRSVTVTGDAVEAGTATLRAAADGYCVQANDRNQKTAQVELKGVPALQVVAYDEHDPVAVGKQTTYDIKVRNQGTAPADHVAISGNLGDELRFVQGAGATNVRGNGTSFQLAPVKRLAPGETAGWTVTVKGDAAGYSQLDLTVKSSATKRSITDQEPTRVIH